jgi:hypothetical protein
VGWVHRSADPTNARMATARVGSTAAIRSEGRSSSAITIRRTHCLPSGLAGCEPQCPSTAFTDSWIGWRRAAGDDYKILHQAIACSIAKTGYVYIMASRKHGTLYPA